VKRARFLPAAQREYLAEIAHYDTQRKGVGRRFQRAVERAASLALSLPFAGAPCGGEARKVVVKGFPFYIVYRPEAAGVVVFAVAHSRRDPGYWLGRV